MDNMPRVKTNGLKINRKKAAIESIRVCEISVMNYKGIEKLKAIFPSPTLDFDPDVFVIGGDNGSGKSALLESIALLLMAPYILESEGLHSEDGDYFSTVSRFSRLRLDRVSLGKVDYRSLLFYFNSKMIEISGIVEINNKKQKWEVSLKKLDNSIAIVSKISEKFSFRENLDRRFDFPFLSHILGFTPNSYIGKLIFYINSYRKTNEANPELGSMVANQERRDHDFFSPDFVKQRIIICQMAEKGMIVKQNAETAKEELKVFNQLLTEFTDYKLGLLQPNSDNSMTILLNAKSESKFNIDQSFSYDGLSSGQKEIVSTLFQIYVATKDSPKVVIIDEPELHLNIDWHKKFMQSLFLINSKNQYFIATHSARIARQVENDRKIMLFNIPPDNTKSNKNNFEEQLDL